MPQTNCVIEREVLDMMTGTRIVLVVVGLLGHVWPYAAPFYMHLDNCLPPLRSGQFAWSRWYGEELRGSLSHSGRLSCLSLPPTQLAPHKPHSAGVFGCWLGDRFALGGSWDGDYLVEGFLTSLI